MVRFIGLDEATARCRLERVGTEILQVGPEGSDLERDTVVRVLPDGERQLRGTFEAQPPAPGEEHAGVTAWHTNAVIEAHTFTSGRGVLEFWTEDAVLAAGVEPGGMLGNRGAEPRSLPVVAQQLQLRHSGPVEQDLGYVATGRPAGAWPDPA